MWEMIQNNIQNFIFFSLTGLLWARCVWCHVFACRCSYCWQAARTGTIHARRVLQRHYAWRGIVSASRVAVHALAGGVGDFHRQFARRAARRTLLGHAGGGWRGQTTSDGLFPHVVLALLWNGARPRAAANAGANDNEWISIVKNCSFRRRALQLGQRCFGGAALQRVAMGAMHTDEKGDVLRVRALLEHQMKIVGVARRRLGHGQERGAGAHVKVAAKRRRSRHKALLGGHQRVENVQHHVGGQLQRRKRQRPLEQRLMSDATMFATALKELHGRCKTVGIIANARQWSATNLEKALARIQKTNRSLLWVVPTTVFQWRRSARERATNWHWCDATWWGVRHRPNWTDICSRLSAQRWERKQRQFELHPGIAATAAWSAGPAPLRSDCRTAIGKKKSDFTTSARQQSKRQECSGEETCQSRWASENLPLDCRLPAMWRKKKAWERVAYADFAEFGEESNIWWQGDQLVRTEL